MKRRVRMNISICSMILASTAILIQRQESTMNWHDLESIRVRNNDIELTVNEWLQDLLAELIDQH